MMSSGYGKLYPTAFTGSLYGAGPQVYSVLAFAIANAQPPDGRVEINPVLVSGMIGMPVEDVEKAIRFLESPDPKSRTEGEEGRRLVKTGSFEYRLVNFQKYRALEAERTEYKRDWDRKNRPLRRNYQDRKNNTPDNTPDTPPTPPSVGHASASVHASASGSGKGVERETKTQNTSATGDYTSLHSRTMELKQRVGNAYSRSPEDRWSSLEEGELCEVARRDRCLEELDILLLYRLREEQWFPRSVRALLEKWGETLDKARAPEPNGAPKKIWALKTQLGVVEEEILKSPANRDGEYSTPNATEKDKARLKELRQQANKIKQEMLNAES